MLQNYTEPVIFVSNDKELIDSCANILWHIANKAIRIFSVKYDDYIQELKLKRESIENEIVLLNKHKKEMHQKLMKEQERSAKSRLKGEKR